MIPGDPKPPMNDTKNTIRMMVTSIPEYRANPAHTPDIFASLETFASFPTRPPYTVFQSVYSNVDISDNLQIKNVR